MSPEAVRETLKRVIDPEAGMNVVDLGLVYGIEVTDARIHVRMTMTTPSCPMGAYIVDQVRELVASLAPEDTEVAVELVWEPPWTPALMSEHARRHFGWNG